MDHDLTLALRSRTAHIVAYRFHLENENNERDRRMAIEIKGLKAKALAARANLDKLNQAYDQFNAMAPAHAADIAKMAGDLGAMQEDLEFATNVMGNSDGESEKLAQEPSEKPVTTARVALGPHPDQPEGQQAVKNESDIPKTIPMPIFANPPPEVAERASHTFRAAE